MAILANLRADRPPASADSGPGRPADPARGVEGPHPAWGNDPKPKVDFLWKLHGNALDAHRFSDAKAGAALTLASAGTGWALRAVSGDRADLSGVAQTLVLLALLAACGAFFATLVFVYRTIRPRLPARPASGPPGSVSLWDVARHPDPGAAAAHFAAADLTRLADDLARDVWHVARIGDQKFAQVVRAMRWAALSAGASMVTFLILALSR